ncbi:hypothetical protein OJ253_2304 [Cryptosporidium canis]|uniref:Uncharacterized protein n=1 Tax=Cryptosporidium canis TaxID=195482 RepID=A0A9D5DFH5_9CRYT|nr:hypothetical protein OJ253_2304 [Cryptosporidium canis]
MDQIDFNYELKYSGDFLECEPITKCNSNKSQYEGRPNWWRTSDSENILDPCFKKPIYSGKSNFNFLPTFLVDNMKWFKNRVSSKLTDENDSEFMEYDRKSVMDYNRQKKIVQGQDHSPYKYISPYSEYLLERLKWKIALRIYYALDPNNRGYIELEGCKKLLFDMLELDTEMAQTLLLLLETIRPFYAKDGCIEKNDLIVYLAREIFDDTRGYGLFSRLSKIFKNPIIRSKWQNGKKQNNYNQKTSNTNNISTCFSSDPDLINLKASKTMRLDPDDKNIIPHCHNKKGNCITCKMKINCSGKLKDHIKMTIDRRKKLIDRIKQERAEANEKNTSECTFKPEIIWPIGKYIKANSQWSKGKKNLSTMSQNKDKKSEIDGYEVISEQNIEDKNIQIFLNNKFDPDKNWNGYIHDSISNQVYILHKGHLVNDSNIDENILFYRKTDKENQKEIRDKELDSIIRKIHAEFHNLESTDKDEKESSLTLGTSKLIERLRIKREVGTDDPRLNIPEFTIEVNHPDFVEKTVDLSKIKPYTEAVIHDKIDINNEYSTRPCYYYLPRGYEKIGNCFNEIRFRRRLDFMLEGEANEKCKNDDFSSSNVLRNNCANIENGCSMFQDNNSLDTVNRENLLNSFNEKDETKNNYNSTKVSKNNTVKQVKIDNLKVTLKKDHSGIVLFNSDCPIQNKCNQINQLKKCSSAVPKRDSDNLSHEKSTSKISKKEDNPLDLPNKDKANKVALNTCPESPPKKNTSSTVLSDQANFTSQIKTNVDLQSKCETTINPQRQPNTPEMVKNDQIIPPKKDDLSSAFNGEAKPSIPVKGNLMMPPKKENQATSLKVSKNQGVVKNDQIILPKKGSSSIALNGEAKPYIPVNGNLMMPPKKDGPTIPLKVSKNQEIVKNNLIVSSKNDDLSSALNREAKPSIPIKGNLMMPPKKDGPTIPLKVSKNQEIVKNNLIVSSKNDDLSSALNREAKPSIPIKGNLMMPPKKENQATSSKVFKNQGVVKSNLIVPPKKDDSSAALNGEAKPSIPIKGNLMMPPKKDGPTIPLKVSKNQEIVKNNLIVSSKNDDLSSALNREAKPSIPIKGNLMMPPKKDGPTIPLKVSKNQGVVKSNLIVPPKKDDSSAALNGEAKPSIPIKGNLMMPPKKDGPTIPLKVSKNQEIVKNNLIVSSKNDDLSSALNREAKPSIPIKGNLMMPPKKENQATSSKVSKNQGVVKSNLIVPPKKDDLSAALNGEAKPSIPIKGNLMILQKKDSPTIPLKKVKTPEPLKTSPNVQLKKIS